MVGMALSINEYEVLKSSIFKNGGRRAIFELNLSLKSAIVQYGV